MENRNEIKMSAILRWWWWINLYLFWWNWMLTYFRVGVSDRNGNDAYVPHFNGMASRWASNFPWYTKRKRKKLNQIFQMDSRSDNSPVIPCCWSTSPFPLMMRLPPQIAFIVKCGRETIVRHFSRFLIKVERFWCCQRQRIIWTGVVSKDTHKTQFRQVKAMPQSECGNVMPFHRVFVNVTVTQRSENIGIDHPGTISE